MKKENPMLKKALEEAARQELASLPEERQIIRPYSKKFEKDMQTLLGKADTAKKHKRPRVKVATLIAAVLVIVLTVGTVGAANVLKIFSPEWRESIQEAANNATYSDEIAEFDEAFAKADDYFANLSRDTEGADELLLNYDDAYDIGITTEKDGYTFKIDKIVSGQRKCNKVINGSIFDGTAEFQWCVEEEYYLITEVRRTDGKNLTEEDKNIWFDMSVVVAGFNPTSTQGSLRGGYGIGDIEEDRWCMVTEVTNTMMFAGYDLGLVIIGNQDIGGIITYDEVYLDENGLPVFRDNIEGTNLVMKFNIDEKFADDKAAKAYAEEYGWEIGLDLYKK
ncbi:MAG: hypothetical protein J6Q79_04770 [Clostridia bacterium]|nr:hypothetical protein [Clostridia bacterium]